MAEHYDRLSEDFPSEISVTPPPSYPTTIASVTTTTTAKSPPPNGRRWRRANCVKLLVLGQLLAGLLMFVSNCLCFIVATAVTNESPQDRCAYGTGLWVGPVCVASAICGYIAIVRSYSSGNAIAFMVMSIVASVVSGVNLIFSAVFMAIVQNEGRFTRYSYNNNNDYEYNSRPNAHFYRAILAFNIIAFAVSVINMVVSIVSAGMMCGNMCSCCGAKDDFAAVFVSVPTGNQPGSDGSVQHQQQVVLVPYKAYQKHPDLVTQVIGQTATNNQTLTI